MSDDGLAVYHRAIFSVEEADRLFVQLLDEVAWRQDAIKMFGREVMQPRLTAWMGDPGAKYRYSGLSMEPAPWCASAQLIRSRVEAMTGLSFNSVLLNHYRHGNDSMGWHRDNEKELGSQPVIVSVSLGTERLFLLRRYRSKTDKKALPLAHGSVLIMSGLLQQHWEHCLPKVRKSLAMSVGPRINLTFRRVGHQSV